MTLLERLRERLQAWTGAREAEGSGLLSRPAEDRRVGSNPTPSVKPFPGSHFRRVLVRDGEFPLTLRLQDCDAILAALEAALNKRLDFGPGIPRRIVEEAGRRIEDAALKERDPDAWRANA